MRYSVKEYSYTGPMRFSVILTQIGGLVAIIIGTLMAGVFFVGPILLQRDASFIMNISCFALGFLVIGWGVGLTLINGYPTVWVEDNHLVISAFFFAKVRVLWTEVIDVGAGRVRFGHTLVRTHRLSPFHRVYGWMYSRTLHPSFVIGRGIQDYDDLLREIKQRIRKA